MKKLLIAVFLLSGCTSVEEKQAYRDAQIQMVEKQLLARQQMQIDMARAQAAWANAMAEVAKTNPDSADAIAVGLAVAAARNNEAEQGAPIVQLQREENEARAWAQVLAAPVLNTVGLVATTAINANVQKNASDNMAKISINESEIEGRQFEALAGVAGAVTTFGATALENAGGNTTYTLTDEALIDMSSDSSVSGDTNFDSYNTSGDTNADSFNTSGDTDSSTNNSVNDSYNDQSDNSDNSDSSDNSTDNSDSGTGS
jgi:hypothetical protein